MTQAEAIEKGHEIYVAVKNYSTVAKGFAMGSALLAAQLLFQAYVETGNEYLRSASLPPIRLDLSNPVILIPAFIGAMLPFIFSAYAVRAVGSAAGQMVEEVRRQFREIIGILEGKAKPPRSRKWSCRGCWSS